MAEAKRESTRNLLEQIEGGWDVDERDVKPPAANAEAAPAIVEAAPESVSAPSLDELDARWGDDLFGEDGDGDGDDDDDDEEEEEDEEPKEEEAPLPDERLDPVAFAAAKKLREERAAQRKDKRRLKIEAKRAKKKARLKAHAGKQKKKTKKSRAPAPPRETRKETRTREKPSRADEDDVATEREDDAPASEPRPKAKARGNDDLALPKSAPPWRVIAIGAAVVIAVVVLVAALANR